MKAVLALIALLSLAACAPEWTPAESPKANRVQYVEFRHPLTDPAGLEAFLSRIDVGYGDRAMLIGDPARTAATAQRLRRIGLPVSVQNGSVQNGATAELIIGRHVVTPPNCPDWTRDPATEFANRPGSQFGCATATNLGLMVANPGDLIAGRAAPLADGEAATLGIQRYREGKTKPLLDNGSQQQGSTTGGN
jgi:type IV pilus biogenesis protein CpaD/CtpE